MLFSSPPRHKGKKEYEWNLQFCINKSPNYNNYLEKQWESFTAGHVRFVQPPPSVPSAAEQSPEAMIAAGPEEDPPVYLSGACGFLAVLSLWKNLWKSFVSDSYL